MADPTTVAGLSVWYKADAITGLADGAQIATWTDALGTSTAAQTTSSKRPTYRANVINGLPAVRYVAASSQRFAVTGTAVSVSNNVAGLTTFVVAKPVSLPPSGLGLQAIWYARGQSGGTRQLVAFGNTSTWYTTGRRLDAETNPTRSDSPATATTNVWHVVAGVQDYTNGVSTTYLNGTAGTPNTALPVGNTSPTNSFAVAMGSDANDTGEYFDGDIAEILTYNRTLTTAERLTVHTYLAEKYGITVAGVGGAVSVTPTFVQAGTAFGADATSSTTATLPAASTSGNLLVGVLAADKNTGTATWPTGWTVIRSLPSASVSLYYAWKVSTGETSVTVTTSTAATSGSELWVGEYTTAGGGPWLMLAAASTTTTETTTTSQSTGTTAAATQAGLAIAVAAMDSATSGTATWSNGFASRFASTYISGEGHGAAYVAEKVIATGGTAQSTLTYADTDQTSAAVAIFARQPGVPKSLAGGISMASSSSHQAGKVVTGSSTGAGTIRRAGLTRALAGSIGATGSKRATLPRTLFGAIFTTAQTQRGYPRTLTGNLAAAGTVTKRSAGRFMAGTITGAATVRRAVAHTAGGTVAPGNVLRRGFARTLTGATSPQGVTNRIAVRIRNLAATLTPAGATARAITKRHTGTTTPAGLIKPRSIVKRPKGAIAATSSLVAGLFRRVFGPAGTCEVTLQPQAEVDIDVYLAHRCQMVLEVVATTNR